METDRIAEHAARDFLAALLRRGLDLGASDIHLAPGLPPYYRVHGELGPDRQATLLEAGSLSALARELLVQARRGPLPERGSIDGAISGPGDVRFRFNVFLRRNEWAIALRRLEHRFHSLAELGLPLDLYHLCHLHDGLILVAGPTGVTSSRWKIRSNTCIPRRPAS